MLLEECINNISLEDAPMEEEDTPPPSEDRPKALVVTNVPPDTFEGEHLREEFEAAFLALDPSAVFVYLPSFRRVRVTLGGARVAEQCRALCHGACYRGHTLRCFTVQPLVLGQGSPHLAPPAREKQFLISPPASPPVDWRPVEEGRPVINYDLLRAVTQLAPGEAHELHPPSVSAPGIIVHICEEAAAPLPSPRPPGPIPQTSRPSL